MRCEQRRGAYSVPAAGTFAAHADRSAQEERWRNMTGEPPLPPTSTWRIVAAGSVFAVCALAVVVLSVRFQLGWLPGLLLIAPAFLIIRRYYKHPCPDCGTTMKLRKDYLDQYRFRAFLDCPSCKATWDTGDIGDDGDTSSG